MYLKKLFPLLIVLLAYTDISSQVIRGCRAKRSDRLDQRYTLYGSSGNMMIDQVTQRELLFMQQRFLVYPIFYFYDDRDGKNAIASEQVTNRMAPDGTVIFGKRLFNSEMIKSFGGTTIPIIIAHEFAHLVDYKYGALTNVSTKKRELFADYLAGMYMYIRITSLGYVDVYAALRSFESLGDTDFGDVDHHGTPEERSDALQAGFEDIKRSTERGVLLGLSQCIEYGKTYIEDIEDPDDGTEDPDDGESMIFIRNFINRNKVATGYLAGIH